jgi:hypothetical protein
VPLKPLQLLRHHTIPSQVEWAVQKRSEVIRTLQYKCMERSVLQLTRLGDLDKILLRRDSSKDRSLSVSGNAGIQTHALLSASIATTLI